MGNIQNKQKWSWSTGNVAMLSLAIYIATVFVFSSNIELNIYSQVAFLFMCMCSFLYILTEKKAYYVNGITVWLFGLLLLAFASLSWSMDVAYGTGKIITLVQLVFLCVFANIMIDSPQKVDFTITAVIFSGYFMYLYTFSTVGINGMIEMFSDDIRLGGQVNQENTFGYYSAIVFAFALYKMIYKNKKWYFFFLPLPLIMGLFSGSKKSLLLLIVVSFLLIALKEKKKIVLRTIWAGIKFTRSSYIPRVNNAFTLGFDKIGVGMPTIFAVFTKVRVMKCGDFYTIFLKNHSVLNLVLNHIDSAHSMTRHEFFYVLKSFDIGNINIIGIILYMRRFICNIVLINGENQIRKTTDVVDVHMGNKHTSDG